MRWTSVARWFAALAVGGASFVLMPWPHARDAADSGFRAATWEELIPKDWDPVKHFQNRNLGAVAEGSYMDFALMRELRAVWDNAPVRTELGSARLKLSGYVVPLDLQTGQVREFLLVPYFGACIHSPPPPANQIVHVVLAHPQALRSMTAVSVSGTLEATRQESAWGTSGYGMQASLVEPYKSDAPRR